MTIVTDKRELEWRLIYAIIVAGKSAKFAQGAMDRLIERSCRSGAFEQIKSIIFADALAPILRRARTGNYTKLEKALRELVAADLDLSTCEPADLEAIHGIGMKTSRFFIIWTRPDAKYAALDVHVLRWMRAQGHDVPRQTPSGRKYLRLEKAFIEEAAKRNMTVRELDAQIWDAGASA